MRVIVTVALLVAVALSGCASTAGPAEPPVALDMPPSLAYAPVEPDMALQLLMEDLYLPGADGVTLHARIVRPEGAGPFPIIVQDTPYTGTGCNVALNAAEPPVGDCNEGRFDNEFVRRGYAFAYADLRGTGDSTGCLDLRGQADIADIGALADNLAALPWSNGNIGFIGASYPGSTSHMAALSSSDAVKAVVPVVASTSFYHYHHNDGVPYNGNHALGGTNTGYTSEGVTPTLNPLSGVQKLSNQPLCPHVENAVMHGGLDQSGDYYAWWQERNLRPMAETITTPVLMAQGLADWNVKPDHIAEWFNAMPATNKTFIGGQWGHAYPASDDGACPDDYDGDGCLAPWGGWWAYAAAFFDTYLKGVDTGMFEGSTAWVQDNAGTWHRSKTFPLMGDEADGFTLQFAAAGLVDAAVNGTDTRSWHACPRDQQNRGTVAAFAEDATVQCEHTQLVFESEPFSQDTHLSGVPLLNLTLDADGKMTHIVAVMDVIGADGEVRARENYGYLNTRFWKGFPEDAAVPSGAFSTTLDMYPQEDLIHEGERLRITLRSHDDGRSIESFEEGDIALVLGDGASTIWLPTRSAELLGTRL